MSAMVGIAYRDRARLPYRRDGAFQLFVGGKPLREEIELGQPLPVGELQPLSIGDINEQESEDRNEKQKFHAHPKRKALAEMSETSQLPVFPGRPLTRETDRKG